MTMKIITVILVGMFIILSGCLEAQPHSPTLLNSSIAKIEVHEGLHGFDFIIINIYNNNTAGIEIGVHDSNKYIYKGSKQVPLKQILPDLELFVDLFNEGMNSKHVEVPLERAMSYDYLIDFYLKDGRRYGIAQIMDAPIYIVGPQIDFFLEKYSIPFQSPLREIGVKTFNLPPAIQEKYFDASAVFDGAGTPSPAPSSRQPMIENILLWVNGESKFIADENSSLSNFLLKTLHRVDIQAKCVFSQERVQRMKKNDTILEMSFRFPENITISQQIGPNHSFIPTNESGYRILENVSDALFILEDNLNEELKGHILVSYEEVKVEGTTNYACWAVREEGSKEIDKTWIDEINTILLAISPANSSITLTGMLTVVTGDDCGIPEGCGPKYKLWDSHIRNFIPLLGSFKKEDSELIVRVTGTKAVLPPSEYGDMNYMGPTDAIKVISYSTLSQIQYHKFLVNKAGEYTSRKYPCLSFREEYSGGIFTRWNKAFSWEVHANSPILKVRMTNTSADKALQPFYELWYNGNSGSFIKESKYPSDAVFCP